MKSEFLKMLYHRWILPVSLFIPPFTAGMASLLRISGMTGETLVITKCLQSIYLTQNFFALLAVLYFGEEWKRASLRTGLLCQPARMRFYLTKMGCLFIWITIVLSMMTGACALTAGFLSENGGICPWNVIISTLPASLSLAEITMMTAALTVIFRSGPIALAGIISMLMGVGHLFLQFGDFARCLPGIAAMNAFYLKEIPGFLSRPLGLAVQGIWCAVAMAVAGILFCRRSVR